MSSLRKNVTSFMRLRMYGTEWKSLGDNKSILPLSLREPNAIRNDPEQKRRIMRSRFVLAKKGFEDAVGGWKAKARWIALGFEDPGLSTLKRSSPTASSETVRVVLATAAQHKFPLLLADVNRLSYGKGAR